jgi:murein DD-endopeptidase MepM/ murein hydrolase activator NlpD
MTDFNRLPLRLPQASLQQVANNLPSILPQATPNLAQLPAPELTSISLSYGLPVPEGKGTLASGYGWQWGRMHRGIDIVAPLGTPILAAEQGKVVTAGWNEKGYGNVVEIEHPDGSMTLYAHNQDMDMNQPGIQFKGSDDKIQTLKVGDTVTKGQQIANLGQSGFTTAPHSHFELRPRGSRAVNPLAFFDQTAINSLHQLKPLQTPHADGAEDHKH